MDHRIIKFMNDHVRLLASQQSGKAAIKRLKAVPAIKGKRAKIEKNKQTKLNEMVSNASASRNSDVKLNAIDALLG